MDDIDEIKQQLAEAMQIVEMAANLVWEDSADPYEGGWCLGVEDVIGKAKELRDRSAAENTGEGDEAMKPKNAKERQYAADIIMETVDHLTSGWGEPLKDVEPDESIEEDRLSGIEDYAVGLLKKLARDVKSGALG